MPNVWISADLHLWTQEHDSRHPYRSQRQIDELAGTFAQMLRQDDILIFLGDLCDPSASDLNKVAAFVRSIPCTKLMCRGNHDTEDDAYYLEAGFDQVTDLIRMHNIIFSHKPVSVAPDEVNVHAHLHTLKMSNLTAQHINAYGALNGKDIPLILLDDLFAQATLRSINNGEEVLTGKQWEEMHMYVSLDHDHYRNPVDITDLVPLCPVDESGKDTLVRIIEFNNWINQNFTYGLRINGVYDPKRNTTAEDWDKHLIVQSPKQIEKTRVGVCWDYTSYEAWYFKKNFTGVTVTAWYIVYGLKPDCPTHTFLTFEYEGNYYYFDSSFSDVAGVWAADNEKDIINFVIDSMMKHDPRLINEVKRSNFGLFKYDPLDEELFGLGCVDYMQWMVEEADEIKHRYNPSYKIPVKMNAVLEAVIKEDILDEVLFQDSEDVKYWMTDDKTYRKKADKGEESDKSVAAIDETWAVVSPDYEINIDKWKPGNPLWIAGSSGDGKSTLAKKLAEEHNAEIITGDIILCRMGWSEEKFNAALAGELGSDAKAHSMNFSNSPALDYVMTHPDLPRNAKDPKTRSFNPDITDPEMKKFFEWLMIELATNPKYKNKLYIIESCDICIMDPAVMVTKPLIIVGGSRFRSLLRRVKRDVAGENKDIVDSLFKQVKKYKHQGKRLDDNKESFRDAIISLHETANPNAKWNDRMLYYVSPENMDDELYPIGKCLWETVPRAAFHCALGRDNPAGHGELWVHAIEPGYYQLRSSVEEFGAWWSVDQINLNTVGKVKIFVGDDGETYMDWLFKYVDGVAVECNPDGTFKDATEVTLQETSMASTLEKGHQQNGRMSLSGLKRITIDEGKRKELSNSYGFLKHFYGNDEWHQTVGWLDRKGNLVAAICVSKPDSAHAGQMWLTDFEIVKEYRGYGLSKQILDYACRNCGADALGVAKDNKIARKVYEDYGFKYGNQVHKKDKAGTNRLMYLPETVIMVDPENTNLVNLMTDAGYVWADWKNRGREQPMVLQEMAYEDAADLMRRRLGHYCKEFNSSLQFEQIEKVWKKNWPSEKPPKLSAYMEVSSDSQLCFNLAHEISTDSDDGLKKVVTYTKIMHDLRKKLEKDKDVKDCAYIVGMYDLVEDGVLLYVNLKGIDAFSADSPEVYWPDVTAFEQPRENENDYVSHDGVKVVFENDKHVKIGEVSISGTATDEPYLYDLEVYPRYRGKKYGNAIMHYVMQKYKPTELCVEWKNEIAQKLYERFGFKKDSIIEDYRTTLIVMRTTRKHTGSFKSNEESISESAVETHPMDRDEKRRVAEKYGIRPVGQTHDEADKDEAIEKQKELDRKKRERLKQLEKGRNTQKRNRVIKKIKSHLPGAKNEGAGSDEDDAFYLTDGQNTESGSLLGDHIEVFKDPKQFEDIVDEAISGYRFELLDRVQFFDRLDENAVTDKVFHPVYVVLMHTGSLVATAIKTATNCEFSHVSIAFDSGLKSMFSFGGHKVGPNGEPQHSGFKKESLDDNFFKDRKVPYAIYAVPCTKGQLAKMKKRLDYFVKNENKFYFDFTGLIKNFFGVSDNPQNRWFCSRFVSDILNSGTPNDPLVKDPSLMRPEDFKSVDFAFRVDSGEDLREINSKKIDRATKTAFKTVSIKKAAVTEGAMHLYPDNPYEKQVLMYQLSMMDEGAVDGFIQYLQSFKIRVDGNGNILITRREFDQLDSHFRQSMKMIKSFETAGNVQGVKDELCKIHYMIELINQYYLREDVKNLKPTAKDVRKDMLDLRSVMLNVFKQHLGWVTQHDSKWNFQRYYESSKYGKDILIPGKLVTAIGKALITKL